MTKTHRGLILATSAASTLAAVLAIVALSTQQWIVGDPTDFAAPDSKPTAVNYGLFTGTISIMKLDHPINKNISLICIYAENACALVYKENLNDGESKLRDVLNGKTCHKTGESPQHANECSTTFINAGLWVMTLTSLAIALFLGATAALFSAVNAFTNPINSIFNVYGLYVWNGAAACMYVVTIALWGAQHGFYIRHNLAILDTLNGVLASDGRSQLGYSYWILFGAPLLHALNEGLLYMRRYLINKIPAPFRGDLSQTDGTMVIY